MKTKTHEINNDKIVVEKYKLIHIEDNKFVIYIDSKGHKQKPLSIK